MSVYISQALALALEGVSDGDAGIIGYRNLATLANLSATTSNFDYPVTNLANTSTASLWKADDNVDPQYVTINGLGTANYIGLARHNLASIGAAVSVEALDGATWTEIFAPQVLNADDPTILRFDTTPASGFRLKIDGGSDMAEIAILYCGELLELQRRIYVGHTPIPYGRVSTIQSGRSESGNFLGRVVLQERLESGVELQNLTPNWYRESLDPFIRIAKTRPFFYSWRPASYPEEVGFCWLTNDPQPVNQLPNGMMQIALNLGGFAL